jgi:hypothetical protein
MHARRGHCCGRHPAVLPQIEGAMQHKSKAGFGRRRELEKCDVTQVSHTGAIIGCLIFVLYAAEHCTDSPVTRLQWSLKEMHVVL